MGFQISFILFFFFFSRNCFTQVFDAGGGRCGWAKTMGGLAVELGVFLDRARHQKLTRLFTFSFGLVIHAFKKKK